VYSGCKPSDAPPNTSSRRGYYLYSKGEWIKAANKLFGSMPRIPKTLEEVTVIPDELNSPRVQTAEANPSREDSDQERWFHSVFSATFILVSVIVVALLFFGLVAVQFGRGYWLRVALNHFPAVLGLPGAAAGALVVVLLLRNTEGPIEFSGLGFSFKGASGPVVLWVLCFLAIVAGIRLLWPLSVNVAIEPCSK
jgi:hypothetical protein